MFIDFFVFIVSNVFIIYYVMFIDLFLFIVSNVFIYILRNVY